MDERALADLAGRQRGVVSIRQLRAAGFDNAAIKRRCRAGRLHRLHRGIYLVGHSIAPEGARAGGRGGDRRPFSPAGRRASSVIGAPAGCGNCRRFVTGGLRSTLPVPGRDPGCKPGIEIHRARTLRPRDVRRLGGIPLTTPARTLLDVAALLAFDDLVVAFADARQRQLLPDRDVAELLARSRGRRGAKTALLRTRPRARCDARCARVVVRVTWRQLIARQHAVVARIAAAIAIRS